MFDSNFELIQPGALLHPEQWPQNAALVVKAFVANALQVRELGMHNDEESFAELMPEGVMLPELRKPFRMFRNKVTGNIQTQGFSTCAMGCDGLRRRMGVAHQYLYERVQFGAMISQAIQEAKKDGAWVSAQNQSDYAPFPPLGSYTVIGCRSQGESLGGMEHVLMPVDWDGDDEDILVSVDAGQVDDATGQQCFKLRKRKYVLDGGHLWLEDVDRAQPSRRRILGWIDHSRVRYNQSSILVPDGWDKVELNF